MRTAFKAQFRLGGHDGKYHWFSSAAVPYYNDNGLFSGFIGSCTGIDDLLESERIKTDLINAHALRIEQAINEELAATNEELTASNEELASLNEELHHTQKNLHALNLSLEGKVMERTQALTKSEAETQALNEELNAINEELAASNEELAATNEELLSTNEELSKTKSEAESGQKIFRTIAQNIPGSLVILMDAEHRFMAVEGDLMLQMGYNSRDYTGKHPTEVAQPERYEAMKPLYDRMFNGEQFRIERKSSDDRDYQMDFVPLYNDTNEVYAGLIIALDISDRKQAEERSAKLAAIVESSDDAIIGKDLNGTVTSWNRGAEQIFGYKESEILGESILTVIPHDRQHEEPVILGQLRKGEKIDHYETVRQAKDGTLINVALTISPIHDKEGKVIGVSKIARDITEQKRDEQRKNDFIGMVSHELKTPLTSLSAILQVASAKLKSSDDPFLNSAGQKAVQQVKRMTAMINGFLNVSRLESGKMAIEKHSFDIKHLIAEVIEETSVTSTFHQIEFVPCEITEVSADRAKISSVLSNLISNAIKYSPNQTTIRVQCKVENNRVIVSVQDKGIGIKPEDADKIFERYYRVQTSNMQHVSGFGIGLYLCAEIIKRHDGEIGVYSEMGQGSTFYFDLPVENPSI